MHKIWILILMILLTGCTADGSTSPADREELPNMTVLNIAHRGARSLAPENTLAAARKGLELKADLWELDVAVTSDGELVVLHDDSLERTSNARQVFPEPQALGGVDLQPGRAAQPGFWLLVRGG